MYLCYGAMQQHLIFVLARNCSRYLGIANFQRILKINFRLIIKRVLHPW